MKLGKLAFVALSILYLLILFGSMDDKSVSDGFNTSAEVHTLTEGWVDSEGEVIVLPHSVDYSVGPNVSYSMQIPDDIDEPSAPHIYMSARYVNISFYLDDEFIGACETKTEEDANSRGKLFKLIPLPADFAGRNLRVDIEFIAGSEASYALMAPQIGTKSNIIFAMMYEELLTLLNCVIMLCFASVLLLCGIKKTKEFDTSDLFRIGVTVFVFALYCLANLDTVRYMIPNSHLVYVTEFLLLACIPIPIAVLIGEKCNRFYKNIMDWLVAVLVLNIFLQAALHYFTPLEVRNTVGITHIILVVVMAIMGIGIWKGCSKKDAYWFSLSIFPVFLGTALDLLLFTFTLKYLETEFVNLGIMVFVIVQVIAFRSNYLESCRTSLQAEFYQHAAMHDSMTSIKNRRAFESRILEIEENIDNYKNICCAVVDINYLKRINDTMGHAAGDELIQDTVKLLSTIVDKEDDFFRTGGDEFAMLFADASDEDMRQKINSLGTRIAQHNTEVQANLSLSLGYDQLILGESNAVEKMISRADKKMYEQKRYIKSLPENNRRR